MTINTRIENIPYLRSNTDTIPNAVPTRVAAEVAGHSEYLCKAVENLVNPLRTPAGEATYNAAHSQITGCAVGARGVLAALFSKPLSNKGLGI